MRWGRIVEFGSHGLYVKVANGFLVASRSGETIDQIPLSDVKIVLINQGIFLSSDVIHRCVENNVAIIFNDGRFLPTSQFIPTQNIGVSKARLLNQVALSKSLSKRLWKVIVQKKIDNQSRVLKRFDLDYQLLIELKERVDDGDGQNIEAQAAKYYWKTLFGNEFRRGNGNDPINSLLNFGYAIVRSAVARYIVAHGLDARFGIFHRNQSNQFALADDLMEPIRPFIDEAVKILTLWNYSVLNTSIKQYLCEILEKEISVRNKVLIFADAVSIHVHSFLESIENNTNAFKLLEFPNEGLFRRPEIEVQSNVASTGV